MRIEGWEGKLAAHVHAAYRTPFSWGEHDCALWCSDWVKQCTGEDFGGEWRGRYKTATGAARLMKKRGFANVEAIADSHLLSVPVALARRGDILLLPQGVLGICNGRDGVFPTETSVTTFPTLDCAKAWRVG
jgi:hypothetical protein